MSSCQDESIGRQMYKTSLHLRNYAEKVLSPFDLTVEQFHLLKRVAMNCGLSQRQLCEELDKKPANITRILDRMEKKEWIERRPNPADRRSSTIYLREEGQRIITEVSSLFESYSGRFLGGIEIEEERVFRLVLEKIDNNIRALTDEIENKF